MKKMFLLSFVLFINSILMAQEKKVNQIMLDNYTFSATDPVVGKLKLNEPAKFLLTGANANLFGIRNGNELYLRKKPGADSKWYDITIVANTKAGNTTGNFRIVKDEFIKNKVIAHRGAFKNHDASENSISSLKNAIAIGCEGSEFDVWLSSDNIPVICHDPSIGGKKIEETTAAELKKIPLKNGDYVPTLEEYLAAGTQQNKTKLVLEIKSSGISQERSLQLTEKVMELVAAHKAQAWIYYISFNYGILQKILELEPAAKVAYLNGDKTPEELKADGMAGLDYNWGVFVKNNQLIDQAKKLGLDTNFWTVNAQNDMETLLKAGVDMITTNEPELLLQLVKNYNP